MNGLIEVKQTFLCSKSVIAETAQKGAVTAEKTGFFAHVYWNGPD